MAPLQQPLDQLDDPADRLAGERFVIGAPESQAVGVRHIQGGHLAGELRALAPGLACGGIDLVVDVRDVCYKSHVIALVSEKSLQEREDHIRARVADVDPSVDGRSAGVDPDPARRTWLERQHPAGTRVMQGNISQGPPTLASANASTRVGL